MPLRLPQTESEDGRIDVVDRQAVATMVDDRKVLVLHMQWPSPTAIQVCRQAGPEVFHNGALEPRRVASIGKVG